MSLEEPDMPFVDSAAESAVPEQAAGLSDLDQAILDFEALLWKKTALKERAIAQQLGIAPMVYYQRLIALSTMEEAAAYAPSVVRKLTDSYAARSSRKLI